MKINKEKLSALMKLSDDELWKEAKKLASAYGLNLPDKTPPKEQMDKLRGLVGGGKISALDALKLISEYKRSKG